MNTAIIAAAGKGNRMATDRPKQFLELLGIPIIFHTLKRFEQCASIDELVVVLPAEESASFLSLAGKYGLRKLARVVPGGNTRTESVKRGFMSIRPATAHIVAVHDAVIVTNDFNLNKVSQLRGVSVLNINELANALKPVVLPGEAMRVFILKEGKEYNQGVAYLDDGTMVVVDNARKLIGKNADIAVTSVLQTTAGKMIFGRLWEEAENCGHNEIHRTNGGVRRPARDSRVASGSVRITDTEPIAEA